MVCLIHAPRPFMGHFPWPDSVNIQETSALFLAHWFIKKIIFFVLVLTCWTIRFNVQFIHNELIFQIPYMNHPNITNTKHYLKLQVPCMNQEFKIKTRSKGFLISGLKLCYIWDNVTHRTFVLYITVYQVFNSFKENTLWQ